MLLGKVKKIVRTVLKEKERAEETGEKNKNTEDKEEIPLSDIKYGLIYRRLYQESSFRHVKV